MSALRRQVGVGGWHACGLPLHPRSLAAPLPTLLPPLSTRVSKARTLLNFLGKAQEWTGLHGRWMSSSLKAAPWTCIPNGDPTQPGPPLPSLRESCTLSPDTCFPTLPTHRCACLYACAIRAHTLRHTQSQDQFLAPCALQSLRLNSQPF